MVNYLSTEEVQEILEVASSTDLATSDVRNLLLANIFPGYVLRLPKQNSPADQVESDLNRMNGRPYLEGETGVEVPLKTWLDNAINRLRQQGLGGERRRLERIRDKVAAESQRRIAALCNAVPVSVGAPQLERIIYKDDLLPYGWLKGALGVGASVVRIKVTRHENGKPFLPRDSMRPAQYLGTGWLIGKQYLITNHHVVNARSESERNASEADLRKQAETSEVLFDFDTDTAEEESSDRVESLVAWSPCNATPALDYAILKLQGPSSRDPLPMSPGAVGRLVQGIVPVNVVQHPGGNSKSLGIRNNLVTSLGDYDLLYLTDTMSGSSGSPVCNDNWLVIALHRGSKYAADNLNFQGKPTAWVNQGVRIDRIIDDLRQRFPDLWTALGAVIV